MKMRYIAFALAGFAGIQSAAHADSSREWGYWDSAPAQQQAQQPSIIRIATAGIQGQRQSQGRGTDSVGVATGNMPTTIIQDFKLTPPPVVTPPEVIPPEVIPPVLIPPVVIPPVVVTPPPNRWFGYAALEGGGTAGAYDTNAYLETDANWTYGTVPKTFTFRIAGEDMNSVTAGSPSGYRGWNYNQDMSNSNPNGNVHVNAQIPMPSDVPMTIGHWHKGNQTYYTLVGSVTQPVDMAALATGPSISYGGRSMGGSMVNIAVNFSNASWNGSWTAGGPGAVMGGSASGTPAFTATGTVIGSNIQSTAITGVTNLDVAKSFVKGSFYGNGAAALGGLTVINTGTAQHSDLFVTCKGLPSCAPAPQ